MVEHLPTSAPLRSVAARRLACQPELLSLASVMNLLTTQSGPRGTPAGRFMGASTTMALLANGCCPGKVHVSTVGQGTPTPRLP